MKVGRDLSYRMLPLGQFVGIDPDLHDVKAGKSSWNEASYSLSPSALAIALGYAKQVLLTDTLLKDQQSISSDHVWRMKQELDRYHQIADLSNRERLEQQFMSVGSQIGYKFLLIGVPEGMNGWMNYMRDASDEQLVKAIATARYYAENLIALDLEEQLRKANKRITELERSATQQASVLKAVS